MKDIIYNFFKIEEINVFSELEINHINNELSNIEKQFENQAIDFSLLFDSYIYRISFIKYLEKCGYIYMKNSICDIFEENFKNVNLEDNKKYDDNIKVKIIEILAACKLINNKNLVTVNATIGNGQKIPYNKLERLEKEFIIRLESEKFPIKIEGVESRDSDIIKVEWSKSEVRVNIDIPRDYGEEINIAKTLIIHSNYKIVKFEFMIECCVDLSKEFFKSYDEYIDLCKRSFLLGKKYYNKDNFSRYLRLCDNKFVNIMYETSKIEAKKLGFEAYDLFLFYNGVDIKLKKKEVIKALNLEKENIKIATIDNCNRLEMQQIRGKEINNNENREVNIGSEIELEKEIEGKVESLRNQNEGINEEEKFKKIENLKEKSKKNEDKNDSNDEKKDKGLKRIFSKFMKKIFK